MDKQSDKQALENKRPIPEAVQQWLKNTPDMTLVLDGQLCVVDAADIFLRKTRLDSLEAIAGQSWTAAFSRFTPVDMLENLTNAVQEAASTQQPNSLQLRLDVGLDAHPRWYALTLTPFSGATPAQQGMVLTFHDQTDLFLAKEAAEQSDRLKTEFLATISHEIRTPMNAIMGLSDMLSRSSLDDDQENCVEGIRSSSGILLTMISNVIDYFKIDAGTLPLEEEFFNLRDLLQELVSIFSPRFAEKRLAFEHDFAANLPKVVYGDEKRVRQILDNLLTNALKYTAQGHVTFDAYLDHDGAFRFDVLDTGIGLRADDLARLFQPFEQIDRENRPHPVGTGLGLVISHRLATMMGGVITADSAYGKGSTFSVYLPLRTGGVHDLAPGEGPCSAFSTIGVRALVVDDVEINLMVTSALLESFGIDCDQAHSGAEALAFSRNTRYDLIFMDHMMPGMGGIETTQVIRTTPGDNQAVPVIALTANDSYGAKDMFLASGFNDYLPKPIDRDTLGACLLRWLLEDKIVEETTV